MTRKLLILHVGPHKTGTSSLQFHLHSQREWLAAQGFSYPELGIRNHNHVGLRPFFAGRRAATSITRADFDRMISAAPQTLLSSEDFVYLSVDMLKALQSMLSDVEVRIVLFFRKSTMLWPSHWQELIRHGRAETFMDYLAAFCGWNSTHNAAMLIPFLIASKFAKVFGRESIQLHSYDNVVDSGHDLLNYFLETVLGIPETYPDTERKRINRSMGAARIELLRCLNELYRAKAGIDPEERVLAAFQKRQTEIEGSSDFREFHRAFEHHASTAVMDPAHDFIKSRERQLLGRFGDLIVNKADQDQLYTKPETLRKAIYGERFWADRSGQAAYIGDIFASIGLETAT